MPARAGTYESHRDDSPLPACWRARNNACVPHYHSALELAYLAGGEMEVTIDGRHQTAKKGELVVVSPYSVHLFHTPRASDNLVLIIPQDYIASFRDMTGGRQFAQIVVPEGAATRGIARCMRTLLALPAGAGSNGGVRDSYIVRGQVYTTLGLLLAHVPLQQGARSAGGSLTHGVLRYLHQSYRQPLTLTGIAQQCGYSCSRISHIFNQEVGCSIPEYIATLRSRAAAALLLEGGGTITHVAMEAGFESMRSFYRAFNSCFGVSPTQFTRLPRSEMQALMQNNGLHQYAYMGAGRAGEAG